MLSMYLLSCLLHNQYSTHTYSSISLIFYFYYHFFLICRLSGDHIQQLVPTLAGRIFEKLPEWSTVKVSLLLQLISIALTSSSHI